MICKRERERDGDSFVIIHSCRRCWYCWDVYIVRVVCYYWSSKWSLWYIPYSSALLFRLSFNLIDDSSYCLRYTVYGILYTTYCIRRTAYGVLHTAYCIRHTVYGIVYRTVYNVRPSFYLHIINCTVYNINTPSILKYTKDFVKYTLYYIWHTLYSVQFVHCSLYSV